MSTESLPFESDDGTISVDLILPESMRELLAKPFGPVVNEEELSNQLLGCGRIFTVGDIVTATFIGKGKPPDVMIFDCKTKRGPFEEIKEVLRGVEGRNVTVTNPPGKLTAELWNAIAKAIGSERRTKIYVRGEEDLASLVCVRLGSMGDCVIYGIPDEGIAIIRIDSGIREKVRDVLGQMTVAYQG